MYSTLKYRVFGYLTPTQEIGHILNTLLFIYISSQQFWGFLGIYWKTKVWFSQIKPSPIRKTDLVKTQKNEGKSSFLVGAPLWDFCCIDNAFAKVLAHYTTSSLALENNVDDWVEFYLGLALPCQCHVEYLKSPSILSQNDWQLYWISMI